MRTNDLEVRLLRPCVSLQKDEVVQKNVNEAILNRLRPLRGSNSAATLMALTGGQALIPSRKDDALASNMWFSVKTGFFSARMDLMEAQSSSIGQGTPITGLGACFDIINNMLWLPSGEYVDQFFNPGNLPPHHINSRLGLAETSVHVSPDELQR